MNGLKCRTCYTHLDTSVVIINLNSKDPSSQMKVWAKLQLCVPEIELTRTSEEYVCGNCALQIKTAYNFRMMCLKTEAKFQELYSTRQDFLPVKTHHSPTITDVRKEDEYLIGHSSRKHKLTDKDLIAKACNSISELRGKEDLLRCNVSVVSLPEIVIKVTQQKNSVHVCNFCRSIFLSHENFITHVTEHFENNGTTKEHCNLRCDRCEVSFRSFNIYELHLKFMHPDEYNTYSLRDKQEELLVIKNEETIHMEQPIKRKKKPPILFKVKTSSLFNRDNVNKRKCSVCFKIFSTYSSLMRHLLIHKRSTIKCNACNRSFVDIITHRRHCRYILKLKQTPDRPNKVFKCPFCQKGFNGKQSFVGHLSSHGKIDEKCCKKCKIQFDRVSEFAFHLISNDCPYPYTQQAAKKNKKKKSPIICPICSVQQKTKSDLAIHIGTHPNKTIPCRSCATQFNDIDTYMSHFTPCKRGKKTEVVIVKEESDKDVQVDDEDMLDEVVQCTPDLPDLLDLMPVNIQPDPLMISDNLENSVPQLIDHMNYVETSKPNKRKDPKKLDNTEIAVTDIIVQQINKNIKSIIEKMNSSDVDVEMLSETENRDCLESQEIHDIDNLQIENLQNDSIESADVSSSSNEIVISEKAIIPSTSTMLSV